MDAYVRRGGGHRRRAWRGAQTRTTEPWNGWQRAVERAVPSRGTWDSPPADRVAPERGAQKRKREQTRQKTTTKTAAAAMPTPYVSVRALRSSASRRDRSWGGSWRGGGGCTCTGGRQPGGGAVVGGGPEYGGGLPWPGCAVACPVEASCGAARCGDVGDSSGGLVGRRQNSSPGSSLRVVTAVDVIKRRHQGRVT